jgi:hypothetical protein
MLGTVDFEVTGLKWFLARFRMVLTTVTSKALTSYAQACLLCCHEKMNATGKHRKNKKN